MKNSLYFLSIALFCTTQIFGAASHKTTMGIAYRPDPINQPTLFYATPFVSSAQELFDAIKKNAAQHNHPNPFEDFITQEGVKAVNMPTMIILMFIPATGKTTEESKEGAAAGSAVKR